MQNPGQFSVQNNRLGQRSIALVAAWIAILSQ